MAKFKFRLATLLRLREAARDERRTQLAEAYQIDDALKQQIERIGKQLSRLQSANRRILEPGVIEVDQLLEAQRCQLAWKAGQTDLGRQREAVGSEIERRRQALVEADREVRVLEKLRRKQSLRHQHEEDRREIRRLDEVAQQRATRESLR